MKTRAMRKLGVAAAVGLFAAAALAENPFAGTWKFDASKSKITGQTTTFTEKTDGAIEQTVQGERYLFRLNGGAAKTPMGDTVHWTKVDPTTWKAVYKKGTMELSTDLWKLSGDGETVEVTSSGTRPNGQAFSESETLVRDGPGKGFYGKWKSTKVEESSPETRVIEADGNDGLIWNIPELKVSLTLKFDGKDTAPIGPTVPEGLTLAATLISPKEFEMEEKIHGKVIYRATETVSDDGKTMIQRGSAVEVNEPTMAVYDKQESGKE